MVNVVELKNAITHASKALFRLKLYIIKKQCIAGLLEKKVV